MKIIYVCVASAHAVDKNWTLEQRFLYELAKLHEIPDTVYISPSIQNYKLLPYMKIQEADYAAWRARCERLIEVSDELVVLAFPGWESSIGVAAEIAYGEKLGKGILFIHLS